MSVVRSSVVLCWCLLEAQAFYSGFLQGRVKVTTLGSSYNNNNNNNFGGDDGQQQPQQRERTTIPQRQDTCRVLISGVVGADPKETYLANGHYVLNFPLAVTGHFAPIHDWELYKPAETMWLGSELWDEQAKNNQVNIKRGAPLTGVGYLIFNSWKDKVTGEDRKMFKLRLLSINTPEEMADILGSSGLEDMLPAPTFGDEGNDSAFGSDSPPMQDQTFATQAPMQAQRSAPPPPQQFRAPPRQQPSSNTGYNSGRGAPPPASRRGELDEGPPSNSNPKDIKPYIPF